MFYVLCFLFFVFCFLFYVLCFLFFVVLAFFDFWRFFFFFIFFLFVIFCRRAKIARKWRASCPFFFRLAVLKKRGFKSTGQKKSRLARITSKGDAACIPLEAQQKQIYAQR